MLAIMNSFTPCGSSREMSRSNMPNVVCAHRTTNIGCTSGENHHPTIGIFFQLVIHVASNVWLAFVLATMHPPEYRALQDLHVGEVLTATKSSSGPAAFEASRKGTADGRKSSPRRPKVSIPSSMLARCLGADAGLTSLMLAGGLGPSASLD